MKSVLLTCKSFRGPHSAENISHEPRDTVFQFQRKTGGIHGTDHLKWKRIFLFIFITVVKVS